MAVKANSSPLGSGYKTFNSQQTSVFTAETSETRKVWHLLLCSSIRQCSGALPEYGLHRPKNTAFIDALDTEIKNGSFPLSH